MAADWFSSRAMGGLAMAGLANTGRGGPNYESMLQNAQGQYANILKGYQKALQGQQRTQRQTMQGYNQLQQNVLGGLAGAGTARSQEIADMYNQRAGAAQMDLVNRGLGNSTVTSSVGARYTQDEAKAQTLLANEMADTTARYQSQLGLAGLNYRDTAARQRMAMQGQQMGYMGDYQRALGGWAMQGLTQQNQLYAGMLGARGGMSQPNPFGGGGLSIRDTPSAVPNDPYVTLPGYGGYAPAPPPLARPETTFVNGSWPVAAVGGANMDLDAGYP